MEVQAQRPGSEESFGALRARVRPHPRVRLQVMLQRLGVGVALLAVGADVGLEPAVGQEVSLVARGVPERPRALRAPVRGRSAVGPAVLP